MRDTLMKIASAPMEAARAQERHDLAGLGPDEGPSPYEALQEALEFALAELKALREHRHDWNDEQFCNVCGADGAA